MITWSITSIPIIAKTLITKAFLVSGKRQASRRIRSSEITKTVLGNGVAIGDEQRIAVTVGRSTGQPGSAAAACVFQPFPQAYYDDLLKHYAKARDFLFNVLIKAGFKASVPKGAYYIIADTTELVNKIGVPDDFSFSRKLVELTGVSFTVATLSSLR